MLFKIKSNSLHPLSGALPLTYVPARVTRGALVAHMHSFAPRRCGTTQYLRTFVPLSVSLSNDPSDLERGEWMIFQLFKSILFFVN